MSNITATNDANTTSTSTSTTLTVKNCLFCKQEGNEYCTTKSYRFNRHLRRRHQKILHQHQRLETPCPVVLVDKPFTASNLSADAGVDLEIAHRDVIYPFQTQKIYAKCRFYIPAGYKAIVHPRSSAVKSGFLIHNTVVDAQYSGALFFWATNLTSAPITLSKGDRLAQMVFSPVQPIAFKCDTETFVEREDAAPDIRWTRCLGSTGGVVEE
ncbi:deoxyuridine triphosphatase [Lake sturgeon herpesvirus]|nr:deoxyuridine triphosphatase [Lake sturgeon herpesvirus]